MLNKIRMECRNVHSKLVKRDRPVNKAEKGHYDEGKEQVVLPLLLSKWDL